METNNSQEFADYFNECLIIDQSKSPDDYLDEDPLRKSIPEPDFEAEWLRNIGFDSLVASIEAGKEVDDDDHFGPLFMSLTTRQATVVKKRITTLKTTVRKRKLTRPKVRDVREVFPLNSEMSSGSTRSRSATPDSLDSISPSRSSPSPRDDSWLPSGDNGSPTPSQGYHSNTRSSPDLLDSPDGSSFKTNHLSDNVISSPRVPGDGCNSPDVIEREPDFVQIFRTPPGRVNSSPPHSDGAEHTGRPRSNSFLRSLNNVNYDVPILRQHYRQGYDFSSTGTLNSDTGIQILDYQTKGSLYVHSGRQVLSQSRSYCGLSESDISLELRDELDQNYRLDLDWGFEKRHDSSTDDDLPEILPVPNKLGVTEIDDLGFEDMKKIRTLALIELTALFDTYGVQYGRRKAVKKKRKEGNSVFGVPLTLLLEQDKQIQAETKIPLVMKKILGYLEKFGLDEEGILRVPGVVAKIQLLKQEIETHFYSAPGLVDEALKCSSVNDVAALVKQFLRELPIPLLTNEYMDAFFQVDSIPDQIDQIKALKLLVFLLPDIHRNTLKGLFDFLSKVISHEAQNRMSLQNVAMIIAPNLFVPKKQKKNMERDLSIEINMAATTCKITKMMIKYQETLWTVPNFLVQQIRRQNESAKYRRKTSKENGKHAKKFLGKTRKTDIYRKINNEVDFQDGIIRVSALQFCKRNVAIQLDESTTSREVVSKIIQDVANSHGDHRGKGRRDVWKRAVSDLSPSGNLDCLVSLATDPSAAIDNHRIYEVGGNIGERCLDQNCNMIAVYQANPNAEWEIRCKHWSNQPIVKEVILM